jgi:predicted nucleic acid-binding Zn ribbon protein
MTRYRRAPRELAGALEAFRAGLVPDTLLGEVQEVWAGAVGETIAAQAQPVSERGGVLTVSCGASVWAQELDLMAPELLAGLNRVLQRGSVNRLRCVATPPRQRV